MNLDNAKDILEGIGLQEKVTDEIVEACNMVLDALNEEPVMHHMPTISREIPSDPWRITTPQTIGGTIDWAAISAANVPQPWPISVSVNGVSEPDRLDSEFPDGEGINEET